MFREPCRKGKKMSKYMNLTTLTAMLGLLAMATTASVAAEEDAVTAAEDDWIRAEINHDEATLRRVIDDRFIAKGFAMTGQTITERSVLIDGDTAVIFGTTELRFASPGEEDTKSLLRYTATYVKRDGQWRALALHMATRVTE
jgi:hypothetical protein